MSLFHEGITLRAPAHYPSKGIGEEQTLRSIAEALLTVSHVKIHHTVFCVGPHNGKVSPFHYVFDTEGIHFRRDGEQHLDILVLPR